ncbi:MAG: iron ABC transporter permease [Synergistaceae bacterium]|nr:iron ABC transporter permease [Synergistaceae bacterium]
MKVDLSDSATALREHNRIVRRRFGRLAAVGLCILSVVVFRRLTQGDWAISSSRVLELLSPFLSEAERATPEAIVVRSVRLPRLLAALGTGGLLSVSGAVLQGLLVNPLAEPYTLGIAAGAAFGGALGFMANSLLVGPCAFAGALFALLAVQTIAWRSGGGRERLVLAGIVVNAFLSAGVTFLKAIADDRLGAIVLWLMGSFAGASPGAALVVWAAAVCTVVPAWIWGRQLDAVSLGEERGVLLGVDERRLRATLLCLVSLGTAAAVGSFGIIGFVGLVVPHLLRLTIGPSHRPLLILAFLGGACLTALADGAAQNLGELPVGVLTSMIGGPFFCWLLLRREANR